MKRALILIITLSIATFGVSAWVDALQIRAAEGYLEQLHALRQRILTLKPADALDDHARLHERWQKDAHWLNCLSDHFYTRDADSIFRRLKTALEQNDRLEALLTLDDLIDEMEEVAQKDRKMWENII